MNDKKANKLSNIYDDFAAGLSDWYSGGNKPPRSSRDTQLYLDLQREKLRSCGLEAKTEITDRDPTDGRSYVTVTDNVFNDYVMFDHVKTAKKFYKDGKLLYSKTEKSVLYQTIQMPQGKKISPDKSLCCPHCGAPSTIGELQNGCKFCETKFLISDLYPSVKFFHFSNDLSRDKNELWKEIVPFIIAGILIMLAVCIFGGKTSPSTLFGYGVCGGFLGYIGWCASKILSMFTGLFKGLRGMSSFGSSMRFAPEMKKYDPNFSLETFRDKLNSLFMAAVYSPDLENLSVYQGSADVPKFDIIDSTYYNFVIPKYNVTPEGICFVTVDMFMDCLHFNGTKITKHNDKFRMIVKKSLRRPTDLGFSIKAVKCPVCGGSFDAERVRCCPFCGEKYDLSEDDWVITLVKKL